MTTRGLFEAQVHRQRGHDRRLFPRNAGRSVGFELAESPLISTPAENVLPTCSHLLSPKIRMSTLAIRVTASCPALGGHGGRIASTPSREVEVPFQQAAIVELDSLPMAQRSAALQLDGDLDLAGARRDAREFEATI